MAELKSCLGGFLTEAARTPFVWGGWDCLLFPADWLIRNGWPDAAADVRGRYRTALGAARLLKRHGGLLALATARMAAVGLQPADAPLPGDVGVVEGPTVKGLGAVGAVCTGPAWATLGASGLNVGRFKCLAAWRV